MFSFLFLLFSIVSSTTIRGSTTQVPCFSGSYIAYGSCQQCGPNTYTNSNSATACINCPTGQNAGWGSSSCITCLPYQFFFAEGGGDNIPVAFCMYCQGATYFYQGTCVSICPSGTTAITQTCSGTACPACL